MKLKLSSATGDFCQYIWPDKKSLPNFIQRAFTSGQKAVRFDSFDCQNWLWLVTNAFAQDTVISKIWNENSKQYKIKTVGSMKQPNPEDSHDTNYKTFINLMNVAKVNQEIEENPANPLPAGISAEQKRSLLENSAEFGMIAVMQKIFETFPKNRKDLLAELNTLNNDNQSVGYYICRSYSLQPLYELFELLKWDKDDIFTVLDSKDQKNIRCFLFQKHFSIFANIIKKIFQGDENKRLSKLLLGKQEDFNGCRRHLLRVIHDDSTLKITLGLCAENKDIFFAALMQGKNDSDGRPSMHRFAYSGAINDTLDVIKYIIDLFADRKDLLEKLFTAQDKNGKTPLELMKNEEDQKQAQAYLEAALAKK